MTVLAAVRLMPRPPDNRQENQSISFRRQEPPQRHQCCGSGMFIPDPTFFHPGSRIRTVSITDPGSASKNLSILTPKKWFLTLENMIRIVHPGSRIQMLTFYPSWIPDPGVKKAPDPGSESATLNVTKKNQFSDPPPPIRLDTR